VTRLRFPSLTKDNVAVVENPNSLENIPKPAEAYRNSMYRYLYSLLGNSSSSAFQSSTVSSTIAKPILAEGVNAANIPTSIHDNDSQEGFWKVSTPAILSVFSFSETDRIKAGLDEFSVCLQCPELDATIALKRLLGVSPLKPACSRKNQTAAGLLAPFKLVHSGLIRGAQHAAKLAYYNTKNKRNSIMERMRPDEGSKETHPSLVSRLGGYWWGKQKAAVGAFTDVLFAAISGHQQ
jgi:hypothetical protein